MTSLKVRQFEESLRTFIADYDLPMDVKRLVLKELYDQVIISANKEVIKETEEEKKQNRTIFHEDSK